VSAAVTKLRNSLVTGSDICQTCCISSEMVQDIYGYRYYKLPAHHLFTKKQDTRFLMISYKNTDYSQFSPMVIFVCINQKILYLTLKVICNGFSQKLMTSSF